MDLGIAYFTFHDHPNVTCLIRNTDQRSCVSVSGPKYEDEFGNPTGGLPLADCWDQLGLGKI